MNSQMENVATDSEPRAGLIARDQLGKSLFALALLSVPWTLVFALVITLHTAWGLIHYGSDDDESDADESTA